MVFSTHDLRLDSIPPPVVTDPLLKDQIRMVDTLPSKESKNYVRKALKRTGLYQEMSSMV